MMNELARLRHSATWQRFLHSTLTTYDPWRFQPFCAFSAAGLVDRIGFGQNPNSQRDQGRVVYRGCDRRRRRDFLSSGELCSGTSGAYSRSFVTLTGPTASRNSIHFRGFTKDEYCKCFVRFQMGYEPEMLVKHWVYREPHSLVARLLTIIWKMGRLTCLLLIDKDEASRGARLRETLTALGPTFVKLGQVE